MNCDDCKHYEWYYEWCRKWGCEVDAREVHNCFEQRETPVGDAMAKQLNNPSDHSKGYDWIMVINSTIFAVVLVIVSSLAIMSIALAYIHMTKYSTILSIHEFFKKYIKDLVSKDLSK